MYSDTGYNLNALLTLDSSRTRFNKVPNNHLWGSTLLSFTVAVAAL